MEKWVTVERSDYGPVMKKLAPFLLLLFLIKGSVFSLEPDYVRSVVYNVNGMGDSVVSTSYIALGKEVQSKIALSTNKDLVSATFYDNTGRKHISTKPFFDSTFGGMYLPGNFDHINSILKNCYSKYPLVNGDPYAYSEVQYYDDPSGLIKKSGAPGVQNRIGSGHELRNWVFGVAVDHDFSRVFPQGTVSITDGLITSFIVNQNFDTVSLLDTMYVYCIDSVNLWGADHILTVSMDQIGRFSQSLSDRFGKTVVVWSDPTYTSGDEIVSKMNYDLTGNLLEQIAPGDPIPTYPGRTKYRYNTLGQIIRMETPDGTIDTLIYNSGGNLVNKRSFTLNSQNVPVYHRRISYVYDAFNRVEQVYDVAISGIGAAIYQWNIYDKTDLLIENPFNITVPLEIVNQLKNLNGELVASVAFNWVSGKANPVIDIFSYNDDGQVEKKFKIVPDLPYQEIDLTYDIHGKMLNEIIKCGNDLIEKRYVYDRMGRLTSVRHVNNNDKVLLSYSYNAFGIPESKTLDTMYTLSYSYSILDQMDSSVTNKVIGFNQKLKYYPDGTIDSSVITYKRPSANSISYKYAYDNANRLTHVTSSNPAFNSYYQYDIIGRFTYKKEGNSIVDQYEYYQKTNRLKKAKTNTTDYMYDAYGNLVVDKQKKLVIRYSLDNKPVNFRFYKDIPPAIDASSNGTYIINEPGFTGDIYKYMQQISDSNLNYRIISSVTMLYDASGKRVLKLESLQ